MTRDLRLQTETTEIWTAKPMPLSANARLGPYEIRSTLGAGGMGEVYRARDSRLNRDVAIKVLREDDAANAESRSRFEREARAIAAFNHPNIVAVYDFGVEDGQQYIVSELIEGESLRSLLTGKPVPVRRLLDIATQVADGLAAAHAAGVVHRDLKPENIMLAKEGRVKILDFGLARQARAFGPSKGISGTNDDPTATFAPAKNDSENLTGDWHSRGNRWLYEPGTGLGQANRFPLRPVFLRAHSLRARLWKTGICQSEHSRDDGRHRARRAAPHGRKTARSAQVDH